MTTKLSINGYKLSEALVQIDLRMNDGEMLTGVLDELSRQRINLVYMTLLSADMDGWDAALAVTADAWPQAQPVIERFGVPSHTTVRSPVGTLTVFPHRSRPALLECVLGAFGKAGLPVYNIASSLSSLTFATDYDLLEQAGGILQDKTRLPANYTPIRPQWRVRQI